MTVSVSELAVSGLPRRVAHASYALLAAIDEHKAPVYSAEVMLYDPEAVSYRAAASALNHAQRRGLAKAAGPAGAAVWIATPLCHDLRPFLEARFLAETESEPLQGGDPR